MQHTDENGNKMIIGADLKGLAVNDYIELRIREFVDWHIAHPENGDDFIIYNMVLTSRWDAASGFVSAVLYIRGDDFKDILSYNIKFESRADKLFDDITSAIYFENSTGSIVLKNCTNSQIHVTRREPFSSYSLTKLFRKYLHDVSGACMTMGPDCGDWSGPGVGVVAFIAVCFVNGTYSYTLSKADTITIDFESTRFHKTYDLDDFTLSMKRKIQTTSDINTLLEIISSGEFELFIKELCNFDELMPIRKHGMRPAEKTYE